MLQKNGIAPQQIIFVENNLLKFHKITPDEAFLQKSAIGYYSLDYVGFNQWNNPNFINELKNQFDYASIEELQKPLTKLTDILIRDIQYIYNLTKVKPLTIVSVPRAKAENTYSPKQLLFKQGIRIAIRKLVDNGLDIEDGTDYILRHSNTKTTHMVKSNLSNNDGEMPYPGITKDTCNIDKHIADKNILLIDDIYTKTINIDEDAIQALYDNGAKSVVFYSVCKTV